MEITIGVKHVSRELNLEVEGEAKDVFDAVNEALAEQAKGNSAAVLSLTDEKGRQVVVPAASLGYVEIGAQTPRPVGFGTS
ncbi:MAG TPA: DUF3107 domain-containing protein [Candidatus Ruania gallistercoris]|uniref:DUF3107 domain-containing protein n=1 Tax=Candidatus Ruania gallistercoris TaxID=2838746 RepID=A0A9D2J3P7_9MICO|nr:DUF3107 domain-containing protein [Candidatus Ruania gallistercoris]